MNKTYLVAIAAALVAAPMAFAHSDGGQYGTPKTYCENTPDETYFHDYLDSGPPLAFGHDGSIPPCPYDPQWDGHFEWAYGGAWLLACEGTGAGGECPNPYGKPGDGTLLCWETYADHSPFPDVWVFDHVLSTAGLPVSFTVGADFLDNVPTDPTLPPEPNCGDFESDYTVSCVDSCKPDFPPGMDGSYQVFVEGSFGHIWST